MKEENLNTQILRDKLLFAALLLNRFKPMSPHHISAIREKLGEQTDAELKEFVLTGKEKVS